MIKNILLLEPFNLISNKSQQDLDIGTGAVDLFVSALFKIKFNVNYSKPIGIPLGLAQLSAIAKEYGISTTHIPFILYSRKKQLTDDEIEYQIKKIEYDMVWISISAREVVNESLKFIKIIKKLNRNTPVILGGIFPSTYPEYFFKNSDIDYIIRGQAEIAIKQFIENYQSNYLKNIQGLCYKNNDGKIVISSEYAIEPHLDKIPPFDLEGMCLDEYIKATSFSYLQTTRGCVFNCPYCSHAQFWGTSPKYRPLSYVIKEMRILQNYGCEICFIIDSTFTYNKKYFINFVKAYQNEKLTIKLIFETRPEYFNEKIAELSTCINPILIWFGGESGSCNILKRIKGLNHGIGKSRNMGKEHIKNMFSVVKIANKFNLQTGSSWIIGLPGENKNTLSETKKVVIDLLQKGMLTDIRLLQIFPGTPYYENPEKWGLKFDKTKISLDFDAETKIAFHSTEMLSREEIIIGFKEIKLLVLKYIANNLSKEMLNFFYEKLRDPEPSIILDTMALLKGLKNKESIPIIKNIIKNHTNEIVKKAALKLINSFKI